MSDEQAVLMHCAADSSLVETCMETIRRRLPVVDRTLREHGRSSLGDYLQQVTRCTPESYQPRADLGEAVYGYAAPLLGESVARQARAELDLCPAVLTANHHGVDFFAQSVQGTLLFSLRSPAKGEAARTVPVLACGNVSMNNLTYPRGLLLYDGSSTGDVEAMPRRLPVFPDRLKRQMVARAPCFDAAMVRQTEKKVARMVRNKEIGAASFETLNATLTQYYHAPDILNGNSYSDQAVILNSRLWQRILTPFDHQSPELVYLELEKVAGILLEHDLEDRHSLMFAVSSDSELRGHLLRELDGVQGCWQRSALMRRLANGNKQAERTLPHGGTFLFWGIDASDRRVPLIPGGPNNTGKVLCGVDDAGVAWEIPLDPQSLIQGLREGRLLPSLFTCFLVTAFARGVTCVGGYYQADYLPTMQQGILAALDKSPRVDQIRRCVASVPTSCYLSGMQAVMRRTEQGGLIPAGPIEIIAGGGLDADDIQHIRSLSVRDAHIASLIETINDVMPMEIRGIPRWKARLSEECSALLEKSLLIK